jgi:LPS O-antigen subunit length determinant protein (WzzB/FepE family)
METPHFDLVDITRAIQKRFRFIVIITLIAAFIGAAFCLIKKNKYEASTRFLVTNPLYGDHNYLFRNIETRLVDYNGGDDDLDRVTAFANSDTVRDLIIRKCQFQTVYKADINNPRGHAYLMNIFNKNFNIKRTEYKEMVITYIAYDSATAANVANTSVDVLEEMYRRYYSSIRQGIYNSIYNKLQDIDSQVTALTDTLAGLRDKYKIYSIISPDRQTIESSDVKGTGGSGYGWAIEQVQNIEAVKDRLVSDRAKYVSLLNEFSASFTNDMRFLKVVTRALPPVDPKGPGLLLTAVIAALLGAFFSIIYVLLMAYYRMINSIQR